MSDHEEADTRMLLYAKHASRSYQGVVIRSPDTEVATLSVTHFKDLGFKELWFHTGVKDRARFIPIHLIKSNLGDSLCNAQSLAVIRPVLYPELERKKHGRFFTIAPPISATW